MTGRTSLNTSLEDWDDAAGSARAEEYIGFTSPPDTVHKIACHIHDILVWRAAEGTCREPPCFGAHEGQNLTSSGGKMCAHSCCGLASASWRHLPNSSRRTNDNPRTFQCVPRFGCFQKFPHTLANRSACVYAHMCECVHVCFACWLSPTAALALWRPVCLHLLCRWAIYVRMRGVCVCWAEVLWWLVMLPTDTWPVGSQQRWK